MNSGPPECAIFKIARLFENWPNFIKKIPKYNQYLINTAPLIVDSLEALDSLKSPAKNFIENALKVSFFIRMHSDKSPFGSNLFFDVKYRWQNLEISCTASCRN